MPSADFECRITWRSKKVTATKQQPGSVHFQTEPTSEQEWDRTSLYRLPESVDAQPSRRQLPLVQQKGTLLQHNQLHATLKPRSLPIYPCHFPHQTQKRLRRWHLIHWILKTLPRTSCYSDL